MTEDLLQRRLATLAVVLLAGILPCIITISSDALFGSAPHVNEPLHNALELVGSCIALGVALLLLLRSAHEPVDLPVLWVVGALVAMGLLDGIHGLSPLGLAWSWLRHAATLAGGLFFGFVWLPLPEATARRRRRWVVGVAALAMAAGLAIWQWPNALPAPWTAGRYTGAVKATNALGGLGFLAAGVFFLGRYQRHPHPEHLLFASHTLIFAAAGLLFGFSERWAVDWWLWHAFRLLAYVVLFATAYRMVRALYIRSAAGVEELRRVNTALRAENLERRQVEAELERHRHHLEDLVEQRTEALKEADRRKDDFLAALSHELRNPLAPLKNAVYLLDRDPGGIHARRALTIMSRQVDHLAQPGSPSPRAAGADRRGQRGWGRDAARRPRHARPRGEGRAQRHRRASTGE